MRIFLFMVFMSLTSSQLAAAEYSEADVKSDLVPSPVAYAIVGPKGWQDMKDLPLVFVLHGGRGSRDGLKRWAPPLEAMWKADKIPAALFVMPSVTPMGFYMNYKDGSERWEDFIVGPFMTHLRATLPVSPRADRTFIMGTSMGGMGALRIAFRYPSRFGAIAALEPAIEPILKFEDMRPKHRIWNTDEQFQRAFGQPVDAAYWAANNPATMAREHSDMIRRSGLQIYVEAGDEDQFWLYEGAEFLHRILWDAKIKHEYHLVRGADHVGPSIVERNQEAMTFLFRSINPWGKTKTKRQTRVETTLQGLKLKLREKDHYNQP